MSLFSPEALRTVADQMVAQQPAPVRPADPPAPSHAIGAAPYLAMAAGNLADGISTWWDLHKQYGHEADPMYPDNGAGVFAIRAAEILPQALIMKLLADHGHTAMARLMGYGAGGLGAYWATHNVNVARHAGE